VSERFDAAVIGMGPGGEMAAGRLLDAGLRVAVVERELIGGECAYWACIPSKTLLRPPEARNAAARTAGTSRPEIDWPALRDYRDYMIRNLDDAAQVSGYEQRGATVVKGMASLVGPGRVVVDDEVLEADHIIVATGSAPIRPSVEGLEGDDVWTNREATTLREIPARAVVLGGSAVGVELGQFLARMGCAVTLVEHGDRLLDREEPRVGEIVRRVLADDGIDVRTGRQPRRVTRSGGSATVELDDASRVETDVIVLGTGRRPHTENLGLANLGVTPDERGAIAVDNHCRAAEGLWALGDVTGVALFTHVAMYQGRIVADNILGRSRSASYEGIPRVVFADPEIAAVGLTAAQAARRGIEVASAEVDLAEAISRPWTYEQEPFGVLGILVDRARRVLVGAWAVAPLASEWIHQAALAIRAEIPLEILLDQVAQYPTYTEGYLAALEALRL
jgi:pyruvate/2-oxoglutarate dehydrogenase complex dihydrolipoamide dehydrogenase (E3) component